MNIKPGDKIRVIKEYYGGTLGRVFTVKRVSTMGGVDTVEKDMFGDYYIICDGEYEKYKENKQLTFIFKE